MKYITLFVAAFLFSNFGYAQQSKSYEINGNVKNIPAHTIYMVTLKRHPALQMTWPIIDSARVTNGNFKLKRDTILAEPSWATSIYYLDPQTKQRVVLKFQNKYHPHASESFILENSKMDIEGDVKNPNGLSLTGSAETAILNRYRLLNSGIYQVEQKIESLKKTGNRVELNKAIQLKNDTLVSFKKKMMMLAEENPSSWMIMINVYQNAALFTPTELNLITQVFRKEVLQTPKGQKLMNYGQSAKNLISGARFPSFTYKDANQARVSLNDVKGKNGTVVIFWASWCGPCRAEIPELKAFYKLYKSRGINFVSISTDHDMKAWKTALKAENMPWPNLSNLPGNKEEIIKKYNTTAIPAIFLVDAAGFIVMPNDYRMVELRENLEKLLSKS